MTKATFEIWSIEFQVPVPTETGSKIIWHESETSNQKLIRDFKPYVEVFDRFIAMPNEDNLIFNEMLQEVYNYVSALFPDKYDEWMTGEHLMRVTKKTPLTEGSKIFGGY